MSAAKTPGVASAVAPALDALCAAFLESLRVRRYAPATLATRAQSLAVFFAFCIERGVADVREVTQNLIS